MRSGAVTRGTVGRSNSYARPLGREAGEIPAQSRYGGRGVSGNPPDDDRASPVAGPEVMLDLREKG